MPCLLVISDHMPPVLLDGAIGSTHMVAITSAKGIVDKDLPSDAHDDIASEAVDCTDGMA